MTLTTSKGGEFHCTMAIPLTGDGSLLVQLMDTESSVSGIAQAFEGIEWVEADGRRYENYTHLRLVYRLNFDTVQIRLYERRG